MICEAGVTSRHNNVNEYWRHFVPQNGVPYTLSVPPSCPKSIQLGVLVERSELFHRGLVWTVEP